jgi:ribosomal protein L16 Arg81 hydroxylase
MLYLPPDYAHDGVAVDECITYSIGFRAPTYQALAEAFLDHLRDTVHVEGRYADPHLRPTKNPARIDATMPRQVARALAAIRWNADEVARFLGRHLTEPKPDVVFIPRPALSRARFAQRIGHDGVRLDSRSQLLYDAVRYYINGDDAPLPAVAPPATPVTLQQEHVVRIVVRADAAAGRGVARHEVVEAGVRNERKTPQQAVGIVVVQIDALHEERPVTRRHAA